MATPTPPTLVAPPVHPPPVVHPTTAERNDAWSATARFPIARTVASGGDLAPVDRPQAVPAPRVVLAALGAAAIVLSWQASSAASATVPAGGAALQRAALLIGSCYAGCHVVFAVWARRHRVIIDALRWRSFRRPTWSGAWATTWSLTTVGGGAIVALLVAAGAHGSLLVLAGVTLTATRVMTLASLGTNMSRVVLGARRRLGGWAVVIAFTDLVVVGVVVNAFVDVEPRRDALAVCAGWASFSVVVVGMFLLSYMKRVERWTLSWWDNRSGVDEWTGVDTATASRSWSATSNVPSRRLTATDLLRPSVVVSYWFVAVAALRAGITVWVLRDELPFATDAAAAIDRIGRPIDLLVVSVVVMQATQGAWSVLQAWYARRCTSEAPAPWGMATAFLAGPAVLVVGLVVHPDHAVAFVALASLVNLGGWVWSSGALGRTTQVLGRSARPMAMWSLVVTIHWTLPFLSRPLALLDDDVSSAYAVVALATVDAAVVVVAGVHAWRAMSGLDAAVRDGERVRREPVGQAGPRSGRR